MHKKVVFWGLIAFVASVGFTTSVHAFSRGDVHISRLILRDNIERDTTICDRAARVPGALECADSEHSGPSSVCGNNVVESGEQCDGSAPEGYACTTQCKLETLPESQDPVCGNNVVESGEQCDGSAPEGQQCTAECVLENSSDNTNGNTEPSTTASGTIVINEVYSDVLNPLRGSDPMYEWFELYNADTSSVDLFGWTIRDTSGTRQTITDHIIMQPRTFAIVSWDKTSFMNKWADVVPADAQFVALGTTIGNGLVDEGDSIVLSNSAGVVDAMSYGDDHSYFTAPIIPIGKSLERTSAGYDTNSASDWRVNSNPTPGF